MSRPPLALRHALSRRLMPLAYALIAVVALIMALTWIALRAQVTVAGFLNGESVWSKAQKQAIIELDAYATDGRPQDYARFESNYELVVSDSRGRDAIAQPSMDQAAIGKAFDRGSVMPAAQAGMIFLMRYFSGAPYLKQAMALWHETDAPIAELGAIARQLHAAYGAGVPPQAYIAQQRVRIRAINDALTPMSSQFSLEIAHGAQWLANILFAVELTAACLAFLLWMLIARRVLAGIRGSEERYRLLFDSAADAIVMMDADDGRILDANRTVVAWTGREPEQLVGQPYADLFEGEICQDCPTGSGTLRGGDGVARPVETQTSTAVWGEQTVRQMIIRDISERVEQERDRKVAAEALASIDEGVIIADGQRRVSWLNAAAERITGFTTEDLAGLRLEATRGMADGGPLPATIWDEVVATHHWSGEVVSRRHDGSTYAERLGISSLRGPDGGVLYYVAVFSDISDAKADRHRLEHLAEHDPLTGLVNRARFQRGCDEAIERAAIERNTVAVLFVDLDAFKLVNDSYSHAVGDRLLELVGQRIVGQLREDDLAGRIGGDEFTVLLPSLPSRDGAASLAARMLGELCKPFYVDGCEIVVSASIGIAAYPIDGDNARTLIANADAAMYAAKTEERNTWRFYSPVMQVDASRRMALATELRQALLEDEFRLVFQPSVEISTGRIVAVEALLRWQHPERGEVMPGEFIPIAESIGLIQRIDEWVIHAACAQIRAWDEAKMPPIRVAINASGHWVGHPGFVDNVRHALRVTGIAPERIALEITEGAMLRLGEETERTMRALDALGIGVAIDDFGTGYASMAYLKLPAVAYLKIDRSFVTGLPGDANDVALTSAMLAMARSLGLTTIAEGIETEAQHEFLMRAGCEEGQGFLYSYPLRPAALERMLRPRGQPSGSMLKLVSSTRR
ncbi:MAG TPA: EAL domain-containing protein [Rhodanobacteraceae bacterium]